MLHELDLGKMRSYRIKRLTDQMEKDNVDALILHGILNAKYVSDFQMAVTHAYGESQCLVLLLKDGEYVLFDGSFFRSETTRFCPWIKRLETPNKIWEVIKEFSLEQSKIGFDFILPYPFMDIVKNKYPKMKVVNAKKYVDEAKVIKSHDERMLMQEAAMIAEVGMTAAINSIKLGETAADIAAAAEYATWKNGHGDSRPFNSYIAAGEDTAFVGEDMFQKRIRTGDLIYIDIGAVFHGYVAEFCRTVACGEPSKKQKDIYKAVYKAHMEAMKIMKPGCSAKEIENVQSSTLEKAGYKQEGFLPIHSIGLGYHEQPCDYLKENDGWYDWPKEDYLLREGMVVNIEPGIFTGDPEIGGVRLEDVIEITENGCKVLTKFPYDEKLLS